MHPDVELQQLRTAVEINKWDAHAFFCSLVLSKPKWKEEVWESGRLRFFFFPFLHNKVDYSAHSRLKNYSKHSVTGMHIIYKYHYIYKVVQDNFPFLSIKKLMS